MTTNENRDSFVATAEPVDLEGIDPAVYDRRWKILAVLCASLMIVIIGNTVLNVALPTLQRPAELGGIGASNTDVQWIVDAYALVFAGLLFSAAALGDRFGRKGALQVGLVIFGFGSLLGALGSSASMLIVSRSIMGIGAAFVMPSTLSILTNVFPRRERPKAIAVWAGISGAGAAVGPITSGLLLEHFWWGSVFLINVPIIAAALIAGFVLVPKSKDEYQTPLDPVGALLSIVGLSALVYAIIEAPNHGWTSPATFAWFAGAAVALVLWGVWEWRNRHPMLELRLFQNPRFAVASGGITLVFFAMFGMFFMLTQYLQGVLDYTPLGAAVRLLPISAVMMFVAPQTPKLVHRFGANAVGTGGLLVVAAGMVGIALLGTGTGYWQLIITVMVMAGGMALTMTPMTTQLMMSVPLNRAGMGSATNDTTRELGGALGVAVLGSLLAGQYGSGMADAVAGLPAQIRNVAEGSLGGVHGLIAQGALPENTPLLAQAKESFVDGLSLAATVSAIVVALAALAVKRFLPSDRPGQESAPDTAAAPAQATPVAGD